MGPEPALHRKAIRRSAPAHPRAMLVALALSIAGLRAEPVGAQQGCSLTPGSYVTAQAPLDVLVSLHARDVALRDALDRLSASARVPLAYSPDLLPMNRRVCVSADQQPLAHILSKLLDGTGTRALVLAGRVVIVPSTEAVPGTLSTARAAPGMSVLERVIVTGSGVASPRRSLVIGVDVIDGERLRRHSVESLSDLINANVAGVWAWEQSPSSLVAQYGGIRGASSFAATYPKIYVDGVEVANPLLMTQIDPDMVDRIEVIRGPQGSALYGADAISGVVNVVMRHGGSSTGSPEAQFRSVAGAAASSYASGLVPTHEQRFTLRAGEGTRSAGLTGSFGQTGALFPSSESRSISGSADARHVGTLAILSASARLFDKRAGAGANPLLSGLTMASPASGGGAGGIQGADTTGTVSQPQHSRQYTIAGSAVFSPAGAWRHSLLAGVDGYQLENAGDSSGPFSTLVDSALRASRGTGDRFTLRESSVSVIDAETSSPTTFTIGAERSVLRQLSTVSVRTAAGPGERYGTVRDELAERWTHNTGLLAQISRSWNNVLFLSAGARTEDNDSFSGVDRNPILPMLGAAWVRSIAGAELKMRFAYGKGIRPPQTPARSAARGYGATPGTLPTALDPEVQKGYEAGLELYLGGGSSLQLTRFDQRATGLIQDVAIGLDTLIRNGGAERRIRYQLQNVGEIANAGWELQGAWTGRALTLSAALSTVDSRVKRLAPGYLGDLRAGDRMLAVPAATAALTATYVAQRWSVGASATRAVNWINYDRLGIARAYASVSPTAHDLSGAALRSYWRSYDGQTHLRVSGSREVSRGLSVLLTGENLLGGQLGEPDNLTIRSGRTLKGGLRASF